MPSIVKLAGRILPIMQAPDSLTEASPVAETARTAASFDVDQWVPTGTYQIEACVPPRNPLPKRGHPMNIGEICSRVVLVAQRETPVSEAARLMRQHHVGALVIVDPADGAHPVGIVTDRDMVVEVLAENVAPDKLTVGDIMSVDIVNVGAQDGVFETIGLMQGKGVRRVVVTDDAEQLIGIVSLDDLLEVLAEELIGLAKTIAGEQRRERKARR